jgi:hypothetical protein
VERQHLTRYVTVTRFTPTLQVPVPPRHPPRGTEIAVLARPKDAQERRHDMTNDLEVIALLLGEPSDHRWRAGELGKGAQRLVRMPDGRVSLEPVESQEEFDRTARTTGCFRRGKPIRDPETHEVIGYEMERVPLLRAAVG